MPWVKYYKSFYKNIEALLRFRRAHSWLKIWQKKIIWYSQSVNRNRNTVRYNKINKEVLYEIVEQLYVSEIDQMEWQADS